MSTQKKTQALQTLSNKDRTQIATYKQRMMEDCAPKVTIKIDGNNGFIRADSLTLAKIAKAFGTADRGLTGKLMEQTAGTFPSHEAFDTKFNNTLAILYDIKPKDTLEGMLTVQMVGVHNLAMNFMGRAALADQAPDGVDMNVDRATKLLRTFTAQIETLNRYRGKGQQKVVVEHVHVNAGGQAIVGTVVGGGGKNEKCE